MLHVNYKLRRQFMAENWRVGVDIGGTFTDVIAIHQATGEHRIGKVRSIRENPLSALLSAMSAVRLSWDDVSELVHATTMVTNTIVEGKVSSVALIATEGFGDSIAIGRQNRLHLYRLDLLPKPLPLVPKNLRFEVNERLDYLGNILKELEKPDIDAVCEQIRDAGTDAVAVSLIHAYANPDHEKRLAAALRRVNSNIALSHQINPESREYERTSTTVLSASVMKPVSDYLDKIDESMPDSVNLYFFHSAGGMTTPDVVRRLPLTLAFSGPAAGVAAAAEVTRQLNLQHAISFDMGGTTTDVCLISDGKAEISSHRMLDDRPVRMPMVAVESIGAGGGSIAWLDTGVLRVGPESAGADPGPACYGRGGRLPTVTDANLVLGYLSADHELGDGTRLDYNAAEQSLADIAAETGLAIHELALGILDVANANMIRALRRISVDRGVDGRQCVLLAFGGAGPIHAAKLARAFEIKTVIVPSHSSIFSAFGCISAEKSLTRQHTIRMNSKDWNSDKLSEIRNGIVEQLMAAYQDTENVVFDDVAAIRYVGQSYSIEIGNPALSDPDMLGQTFRAQHEHLYGFATEEDWELESLRIRASVPLDGIDMVSTSDTVRKTTGQAPPSSECWFAADEAVTTPRYDREQLASQSEITGPAIIEDQWSTTVLPPGAHLQVDALGNMRIEVGTAP